MSYSQQSLSLKQVQVYGPQLEATIRDFLGWQKGRVVYHNDNGLLYDIDVDMCWPSVDAPEVVVSVTYCDAAKPGHSNENKLQLKFGELLLLKHPKLCAVLVIGGNEKAWLRYVLQAFRFFFDEVVYMWEPESEARLEAIKNDPTIVKQKHADVWVKLSNEWGRRTLMTGIPIDSNLRYGVWDAVSTKGYEGDLPENISNSIMRRCMEAAYKVSLLTANRSGVEWTNYLRGDWGKLWESRSFFNPGEAAIQLSIEQQGLAYAGGVAHDIEVPSLLHHLGYEATARTKLSEDFVLFSRKRNQPVFVQSKSTGGGLARHGKNIQNRTKEQLSRSLLYRGSVDSTGQIILRDHDFVWISVLDGHWGVTKRTPFKYLHMLQWAGYDYLIAADSLVDDDYDVLKVEVNPLSKVLASLDCITNQDEFAQTWASWYKARTGKRLPESSATSEPIPQVLPESDD